jgi:hypothetical protein
MLLPASSTSTRTRPCPSPSATCWLSSEDIVKVARRAEELTYRYSTISASRI